MNHDPSSQSPEESELQRVFDETAAQASDAQLERMAARAERIPGARRAGRRRTLLFALAAAAVVALSVGRAWWTDGRDVPAPVASNPAVQVPTSPPTPEPTAIASAQPEQPTNDLGETFDDSQWLPIDPLAVLDGEWDDGGPWMSELDLLHGPVGDDDDAYWEEMDALMEEGG